MLLLPKSFGLDRIQQGDLYLTSSGSQQKTMICKRFLQELTWRHYYSSIFCSKYQTLCCWCVRVADLYKLKLCTFLWPLSCITKFPGTPVSSQQETDILQIEWFIFLFWAAKPAVFAAVDMNFPNLVFAGWWALVPCCALAPGLVVNCQTEWQLWVVGFLKTVVPKQLVIKSRLFVGASGKSFKTELMWWALSRPCFPFSCPN